MSVELYSEEIAVVAVAEGPSDFKIWLRTETAGDLVGDLQWLCEEYLDYHVIVDLAHLESFASTSYKGLMDLRDADRGMRLPFRPVWLVPASEMAIEVCAPGG